LYTAPAMAASAKTGTWITATLVAAVIIDVVLYLVGPSARGRLNVMQAAAVMFLLTVMWRFRNCGMPIKDEGADLSLTSWLPWLGIGLALAVWLSNLTCYFVNDDFGILHLAQGPALDRIKWEFLEQNRISGAFYRPLTYSSYIVEYAIWGSFPTGFHLTSLVLHLLTIAGLFVMLRELGANRTAAAISTTIFAAMPIQAEGVGWMSGRFDVLSAMLGIWAAVAYLKSRKGGAFPFALAILLFALSTVSKETGFVLPLSLTAAELIVFRSWPGKKIVGMFAASAALFAYRMYALGGIGGYRDAGGSSAVKFSFKTFQGLLVRTPSQLLLGFNWLQPVGVLFMTVAALTASLLLFAAFHSRPNTRRSRLIWFGLTWMLISTVPAHFLALTDAGLSNSRVLYLPSAAMAVVLGQVIAGLEFPRLRTVTTILLLLLMNLGLLHNLAAWRWTSNLGRDVLVELKRLEPSPRPNTQFVFSNLPETVRGVYFFTVGLPESIRMFYDRDDISASRDSELQSPASTTSPAGPQVQLKWLGQPGNLFDRQN